MWIQSSRYFLKTGLIGLFLFVAVAHADVSDGTNDPKLLFEKMQLAKQHLSYRGSLAYELGDKLLSYFMESSGGVGKGARTLASLNGPSKLYLMDSESECSPRNSRSVDELSNWYNFSYVGPTRVAGRSGHEIVLRPVDPYRLSYSYAVDQETGLMLRSIAMLPDRRVLERTEFVSLEVTTESNDSPEPQLLEQDVNSHSPLEVELPCDTGHSISWQLNWLPEGFELIEQGEESGHSFLVYSDGVSTFSLFIEPVSKFGLPVGTTQRGATTLAINYFSLGGAAFMTTFVGEVPLNTAERIVQGLGSSL